MRNPTTLYDRNLAQEEPLRSFFRDQACDNTNNKRNEFAILLRLKHIEAVKTWLELSFPAKDAPLGKPMYADHAAVLLFIQFHWLLHTKGQTGARKYLDQERIKRNWPIRSTAEGNQQTHNTTKDNDVTHGKPIAVGGKNTAHESRTRLGSKPINLSALHVMAPKSYSNLRFKRDGTKSDIDTDKVINTQGTEYNNHNPHAASTVMNPAHSLSTSSLNMETSPIIPQKRSSSPSNKYKNKRRSTPNAQALEAEGSLSTHDSKDTLSPISKPGRKVPRQTPPSRKLRQRSNSTGFQVGSMKEARVSAGSVPSLSTQELGRPESKEVVALLSSQGSSQVKSATRIPEEGIDGSLNKDPKKSRPILSRQAKGFGAAMNSISVGVGKPIDLKESSDNAPVILKQMYPKAVGNTATPKKKKVGANVQINPQSILDQGPTTRKSPRNNKTLSESSSAIAVPLPRSGTGHSSTTGYPPNNLRSKKSIESTIIPIPDPSTMGSPSTNLRSKRNVESISRAPEKPRALKRKRAQSLEANAKLVRIKLEGSVLPSSKIQSSIKTEPSGAEAAWKAVSAPNVNRGRKVYNDSLISGTSKGLRRKANSTIRTPLKVLPTARISVKATSKTKKKRAHLSKKVSVSEAPSASNLRIKAEDNMPSLDDVDSSVIVVTTKIARKNASSSKAKKPTDGLLRRQSLRIKNLDPNSNLSSPLINQVNAENNVETASSLVVEVLPTIEKTGQPSLNFAIFQADIVENLPQSSSPTVITEHATAEVHGVVANLSEPVIPTVEPVFVDVRIPETPFSSFMHDSNNRDIEEELPDISHVSSPLKFSSVNLIENREDDEDIPIALYDETNLEAEDLAHLEAEDEVEPQYPDDLFDTLCRFPKTPLRSLPPLWAESRQEICESFDWFRSYQGGVYHAHNVAKGYLLGGFPARRDRFEHGGRLIISHGGGKAESIHSKKGQLTSQPATDQLAQDKSVRALWNNYRNNRPLALLMDDRYALFPYDLKAKNVGYAVLGFYTISDAWAEYQPSNNENGRVVRYKFAFRWDPLGGRKRKMKTAMCSPVHNIEGSSDSGSTTAVASECSPGPDTGMSSDYMSTVADEKELLLQLDKYQWEQWECRNCGHRVQSTCAPREASSLIYQSPSTTLKGYGLNPISEITQLAPRSYRHDRGRGMVQTFVMPHHSAKIHHIQPGNVLGRQEADSIFLDYQVQASNGNLKFRRWPMRAHKCRGSLLTNYFSQNSGAPYKYVGGDAHTVPFEAAPGAVVRARDLIQRRIMQALDIPAQFNEVLSAAYMERQKMAARLGPVVAGLSLGSPALMHFRLQAKHDPEREKRGILLSIVLRHGDILVMDGAAVQDYYEHTVIPTNFRIAATARQIGANHA
ncbi:hypothetical protein CVT25_014507 [Psilocybe cyanescens]|uniref:Alpha-ketoglutarate-dependent dioxygenase AlkB-like domain-containing protein n=1 Tax=Psilocybe cyanescens TaxID=93625 RepID=A0A409VPB7_PSICY|nr:hypothetical protein CVT25_014507 [Psilocybe cyanescens]